MLTRCPACQTVFRVSPEQLAARAGRVRCGHCLNAFNATHNAVAETAPSEEPAELEPPTPAAVEAAPNRFEEESGEAPETPEATQMPAVLHTWNSPPPPFRPLRLEDEWEMAEPAGATAETAPEIEAAASDEVPAAPEAPEALPQEIVAADSEIVPVAALTHSDSAEDEAESPLAAVGLPAPAPAPALAAAETPDRRRAWGIALGGLAMALVVQGLFLLRQPLTQAMPALREPLAELCQHLGCELPLPREAGEISIEASDLHPEPGGQGDFVLHATLKNRAAYPQAYPHVELSLTDAADKALVRRVFSPAEWAPGQSPEAAFAPGATAVVALPFSAAGVAAVGYRVYAFYP